MRLPLSLAIVLAASGCSWIGTDDYTSRLDLDGDGVSGVVDCDDTDASIWEPGRFFVDDDGDGFGDPGSPVDACQKAAPTGAVLDDSDCDDSDDRVHPDAAEVCNGIDDDCDEQVDDDDNSLDRDSAETWLPDADGDGYTTDAFQLSVQACEQPSGFAAPSGQADCDDADSAVNPAAPEACGDGTQPQRPEPPGGSGGHHGTLGAAGLPGQLARGVGLEPVQHDALGFVLGDGVAGVAGFAVQGVALIGDSSGTSLIDAAHSASWDGASSAERPESYLPASRLVFAGVALGTEA